MNHSVSIIIPTYNSSKTLAEALSSIAEQTYDNYEVIVIDNCSSDNTTEIVEQFTTKCRNLTWVSEHDNGIYDAMNKGLKLATCDWIYFLGGDDKLLNKYTLDSVFKEDLKNTDIVYGNVISERFNGRYDGEFAIEKLLIKNICHQAMFFKRTLFSRIGNFNTRYPFQSDWDFNLRCFLNRRINTKFVNIDIALYSDGGFSSLYRDTLFAQEMNARVINYGFYSLPANLLWKLSINEYGRAKASGNYSKAVKFRMIAIYSAICQKFR